jgi:hypothetical protein
MTHMLDEPVFISVDIETTGPTPYNGEILSIGAVPVHDRWKNLKSAPAFSMNLMQVTMAKSVDTMKWWEQWPLQWSRHRDGQQPPNVAMAQFAKWLSDITAKPIFVAWPAAFDFGFINYYFWKHCSYNPFGYSPVCLKNFTLGKLNRPKALIGNREEAEMPEGWLVTPEDIGLISHIALDDAIAQGYMLQHVLSD